MNLLSQREAFLYPSITTATETLLATTNNHAESNASVVKVPRVEVLSCSRNAPEIQKPKSANTRQNIRSQYIGLSNYSRIRVLQRGKVQRQGAITTEENEASVESLPAKDYIKVARMSNRLVSNSFENI